MCANSSLNMWHYLCLFISTAVTVWIIFSILASFFLAVLVLQVRYFHPHQGCDPKLDQVPHSWFVTCVLWCYHRIVMCWQKNVIYRPKLQELISVLVLVTVLWMWKRIWECESGTASGCRNTFAVLFVHHTHHSTNLRLLSISFFYLKENTLYVSWLGW